MIDERILTASVIVIYGSVGLLGGFLFGPNVADFFLVAAVIWLVWDRDHHNERIDEALDDADTAHGKADLALGKAAAIEQHLADEEGPSAGRHAHTEPLPQPGVESS